MFSHIDLLTLLLAPVMAYLAAALIFSAIESKKNSQTVSANSATMHYHDGHNSQ